LTNSQSDQGLIQEGILPYIVSDIISIKQQEWVILVDYSTWQNFASTSCQAEAKEPFHNVEQ